MTPEARRKEAIEEMRALLVDGRDPAEAAGEIGRAYDFSPAAVLQFSARMIENLEALLASAAASESRWQRKAELNGYVQRLNTMLQQNTSIDMAAYFETIPRERLTTEEYQDVFYRCNMAWLSANV